MKRPLDEGDHRSLALWAADCAERVLPYFEKKYPKDGRPWKAIEAARAWARGEIRVGPARAAAAPTYPTAATATEQDWQYGTFRNIYGHWCLPPEATADSVPAVVVDEQTAAEEIILVVREACAPLLRDVTLRV